MRGKSGLILIMLAIPLFLWGYSIFLIARIEFLVGPYFRSVGYSWGVYLVVSGSVMVISYVIVAIRSSLLDTHNRALGRGVVSLWVTWIIGAILFTFRYTSPPVPPNGGPLPENPFILISWVILLTLNLVIALVLLFSKSKSKLRRRLALTARSKPGMKHSMLRKRSARR